MDSAEHLSLSIDEKCNHPLWKVRLLGYEEAEKLFTTLDDFSSVEWMLFGANMKKIIYDSNVCARETGLEAMILFLNRYPFADRFISEILEPLILKCVGSSRPKTRQLSQEICLVCLEIDKQNIVLDELLKGADSKNSKVALNCVSIITSAVREFGISVLCLDKILENMRAMIVGRDRIVRDEVELLGMEIYFWIGPALSEQCQIMQFVVDQMSKKCNYETLIKPVPKRFPRSLPKTAQPKTPVPKSPLATKTKYYPAEDCDDANEIDCGMHECTINTGEKQEVKKPSRNSGSAKQKVAKTETEKVMVNPTEGEKSESIDILSSLPPNFFSDIATKDWNCRFDALYTLREQLEAANKLKPGFYDNVVTSIIEIISKDSNLAVVTEAMKCLSLFVKLLRNKFQCFVSSSFLVIFQKFKLKRPNITMSARELINDIFPIGGFRLTNEGISEALKSKNPEIKSEAALFLSHWFAKVPPTDLSGRILTSVIPLLRKNMESSGIFVRDLSAHAIITAMRVVGEDHIKKIIGRNEDLTLLKIKNINEKFESQNPEIISQPKVGKCKSGKINRIHHDHKVISKSGGNVVAVKSEDHIARTPDRPQSSNSILQKFDGKVNLKKSMEQSACLDSLIELPIAHKPTIPDNILFLLKSPRCEDRRAGWIAFAEAIEEGFTFTMLTFVNAGLKFDDESKEVMISIYNFFEVACKCKLWSSLDSQEANYVALVLLKKLAEDSDFCTISSCLAKFFNTLNDYDFRKSILCQKVKVDARLWSLSLKWICEAILKFNLRYNENVLKSEAEEAINFNGLDVRISGLAIIGVMQIVREKQLLLMQTPSVSTVIHSQALEATIREIERNFLDHSVLTSVNQCDFGDGKETPMLNQRGLVLAQQNGLQVPVPGDVGSTPQEINAYGIMPLFPINDFKDKRARDAQSLKILRWNFTSPQPEYVEQLKNQASSALVNECIVSDMFSDEPTGHMRFLESIMMDMAINQEGIIANLDIILKWISLRLFDRNPSVVHKMLKFLSSMSHILKEWGYVLTDDEAYTLIPYLITKSGESKEVIRIVVRSIMQTLMDLYPPPKLAVLLVAGLKTNNSRQTSELLECLRAMTYKFPASTTFTNQPHVMKEITNCVQHKISSVRTCACNFLVEYYNQEGDKLFKYTSQLPRQCLSYLEEKLRKNKLKH